VDWSSSNGKDIEAEKGAMKSAEYAFLIGKIRGLASALLTLGKYKSILGCKSLIELVSVLKSTFYKQVLEKEEWSNYEELRKVIVGTFSRLFTSILKEIPTKDRDFIKAYQLLFEARSLVAAFRVAFGLDDLMVKAQVLHSGVLNVADYQRILKSCELTMSTAWVSKELREVSIKAIKETTKIRSPLPLQAIVGIALNSCLTKLDDLPEDEQIPLRALLGYQVDAANIITVIRAVHDHVYPRLGESYLIKPFYMVSLDKLRAALGCQSVEAAQFMVMEKYKEIPEALLSEGTIEAFEYVFLHRLAERGRIAMSGYPFQARTIIGFFELRWIEARNVNLIFFGMEKGAKPDGILKRIIVA
jgi:vacuolar-type H+-ATPase subunit C/Vma6